MPRLLIRDVHEWINVDSYCPYLPLGEPTVKGTGLTKNMGKEDPFELNSSQEL